MRWILLVGFMIYIIAYSKYVSDAYQPWNSNLKKRGRKWKKAD